MRPIAVSGSMRGILSIGCSRATGLSRRRRVAAAEEERTDSQPTKLATLFSTATPSPRPRPRRQPALPEVGQIGGVPAE